MHAWPGWTIDRTLLLPLDRAAPRAPVELDGRSFAPKDELHVTLVGRRLGMELAARLGARLEAATRPAFEALDWRPASTGEFALIEKTGRTDAGGRGRIASIIEFVELPALPHWYRWLGGLLGRELALPPAHVTLYVHGCARGIGIASPRALRTMRRGRVDPRRLAAG